MHKNLKTFFDKTSKMHVLLSITLFFIMILMVAPHSLGYIKKLGQLCVIALLSYILYRNINETRILWRTKGKKGKHNDKNKYNDMDVINNVLASYLLCAFIFLLLIFVIYSLFY